jgi:AcrR family transcriptional regulator
VTRSGTAAGGDRERPAIGRRPGASTTREAIARAAAAAFAEHGFDAATVRGIAGAAGVDAALVHHYFGTKEQLFIAVMRFPVDPSEVVPRLLAGGVDGLGERIAGTFLSVWDSSETTSPIVGLIRSAVSHEKSAAMLREFVTHAFLGRLTTAIEVDQPELRAALVGSQLLGVALARYVLRLEPVASCPPDQLAPAVGATLQRYLTAPLP